MKPRRLLNLMPLITAAVTSIVEAVRRLKRPKP
jgi:hypothetical protein